MKLISPIARRVKLLSSAVKARAMRLNNWFSGENKPEQPSEVSREQSRPTVQVELTPEQREDLKVIVNTHLADISTIQKKYTKQGYKVTIE